MGRFTRILPLVALLIVVGCGQKDAAVETAADTAESAMPDMGAEAQKFLDAYTAEYVKLQYASAEAEWQANTKIVEGDDSNAKAVQAANEALAAFTGSVENIEGAQKYLAVEDQLSDVQVRQLKAVLYLAADKPQTVAPLVKERIKAEAEQVEGLYGFDFKIGGESVSTADIDKTLRESNTLDERLTAWSSSKEVGAAIKDGLVDLQRLRNATVQALGYDDFFSYQVSDYGMTTQEMRDLCLQLNREVRPLYRELHTWARYELAKRYGVDEVPDMLPAHWLPNRWGQDWNSLVTVEGLDLDAVLSAKTAEWINEQGERFYVSMGLGELPQSYWDKSSMYPLPEGTPYKKNNHASAWHMDLENDVRCLMSVIPNADWYETVHHELGHIYYYMEYTNPDVPPLLRGGANRAYHEGFGSMLGLAAMQKPFLVNLELVDPDAETDEVQKLLKEALNYIVFIPWSAGVMTEWEYELYGENLAADKFNERWWAIKGRYQGIVPPEGARGEEYCDAASKTHISNDAAQYYDYALSNVFLFQVHTHIARNILNQDPRATNYYGSKEIGQFLHKMMSPGATVDWQKLMEDNIGEGMSANAMLDYFEPLMAYLKEQNEGRTHTLGDL